jgi:hypothetical protein
MSLEAMLAARAMDEGHALRTAALRHRRLLERPLQIVGWQYGVEPFTIGALAFGLPSKPHELCVPGYPINRDLLFWALTPFARSFNAYFELPFEHREEIKQGTRSVERATTIPQLVVPNPATVALLGRLGRRLAYLPTGSPGDADPALVRLGRHLMFVGRRAQVVGQQLVLSATDLLRAHWQTGMSNYEAASLAALDAWIDPPSGTHGFDAAAEAEAVPVGPQPDHGEGEAADRLVGAFNEARGRSVDPPVVTPLLRDLRAHYAALIQSTWDLTVRCVDRERGWEEATHVERRFEGDCDAYSRHMEWMNHPSGGRRRARMTARQTAVELRELEDAAARATAEEAIDDPVRMVPLLLAGKAVAGAVVHVDSDHRELVGKQRRRRPVVVIASDEPCVMPCGKALYWTGKPAGREYLVEDVAERSEGGSTVTLKLQTDRAHALPRAGVRACFSELTTKSGYASRLPTDVPWTHRQRIDAEATNLEATDDLAAAA